MSRRARNAFGEFFFFKNRRPFPIRRGFFFFLDSCAGCFPRSGRKTRFGPSTGLRDRSCQPLHEVLRRSNRLVRTICAVSGKAFPLGRMARVSVSVIVKKSSLNHRVTIFPVFRCSLALARTTVVSGIDGLASVNMTAFLRPSRAFHAGGWSEFLPVIRGATRGISPRWASRLGVFSFPTFIDSLYGRVRVLSSSPAFRTNCPARASRVLAPDPQSSYQVWFRGVYSRCGGRLLFASRGTGEGSVRR